MNYLWVDLEMSGLDPEKCRILELAAVVTNDRFEKLEEYTAIVHQDVAVLDAMDAWCKETHGKSGLTAAVAKGKPEDKVEAELLEMIDRHFTAQERPILCGNSIGQDRKFMDRYWSKASNRLHYRMLDVTSFKIIFENQYKIKYPKKDSHRAVEDIFESIAELKHYLQFVSVPTP